MNKIINMVQTLNEGDILNLIPVLTFVALAIFLLLKAITSFNYRGRCYGRVVNITIQRKSNDSTSSTNYLISFTTSCGQNIIDTPLNNGGFQKMSYGQKVPIRYDEKKPKNFALGHYLIAKLQTTVPLAFSSVVLLVGALLFIDSSKPIKIGFAILMILYLCTLFILMVIVKNNE